MTAVFTGIIALTVLVAFGVGWRNLGPADWVNLQRIDSACVTSAHEATCTFTNTTQHAVKTCARLRVRKKNSDEEVRSVNVCTGRLDTFETKSLIVPWGSSLGDVCSAGGIFDWKSCSFTIEPAE